MRTSPTKYTKVTSPSRIDTKGCLHDIGLAETRPNQLIIRKGTGILPQVNITFSKKNLKQIQASSIISINNKRNVKKSKSLFNPPMTALKSQNTCLEGKRLEETLTHAKRIDILYLKLVHGVSIRKTAART